MATVTHTIYSHYDLRAREALKHKTGQTIGETSTTADSWEYEASLMPRRRQRPPQFVPATISYDNWGTGQAYSSRPCQIQENPIGSDLAKWYRSLRSSQDQACTKVNKVISQQSSDSSTPPQDSPLPRRGFIEKKNKNNWFIMKAIHSEPVLSSPVRPPSLADILARDPPPLPNEGKFTPPVWLQIGPSNRGFAILQRNGWNEGEALGPGVIRRPMSFLDLSHADIIPSDKGKSRESLTKQVVGVKNLRGSDGASDVIDLTLSDSDGDETDGSDTKVQTPGLEKPPAEQSTTSSHGGTALLTPIATVLKSDRLGIGLKAKTVGPYNASQKRVTHNTAASAAHITAAAENRKRRRERGRGRRGYERQRTQEESERKRLLTYLNN